MVRARLRVDFTNQWRWERCEESHPEKGDKDLAISPVVFGRSWVLGNGNVAKQRRKDGRLLSTTAIIPYSYHCHLVGVYRPLPRKETGMKRNLAKMQATAFLGSCHRNHQATRESMLKQPLPHLIDHPSPSKLFIDPSIKPAHNRRRKLPLLS